MRVKIKEDLTLTEKYNGCSANMREMIGKVYKVDSECSGDYVINGWFFCKADCEIVDDYEELDLKNIKTLVIDLSTPKKVYCELENVISDIEDRVDIYKTMDIYEMREFILEYYMRTYDAYCVTREPNVYFLIEDDLYVKRS